MHDWQFEEFIILKFGIIKRHFTPLSCVSERGGASDSKKVYFLKKKLKQTVSVKIMGSYRKLELEKCLVFVDVVSVCIYVRISLNHRMTETGSCSHVPNVVLFKSLILGLPQLWES